MGEGITKWPPGERNTRQGATTRHLERWVSTVQKESETLTTTRKTLEIGRAHV